MDDGGHYTFVNKNASNLTSKEHITAVTSHAQSVTWSLRQRRSNRSTEKRQLLIRSAQLSSNGLLNAEFPQQSKDNNKASADELNMKRHTGKFKANSASDLSNPASDSILIEQLDPFISLASKTTHRERNLLQYYLVFIPTKIYGTQSTSLYCPVRDRTSIFVQRCNVWLQCVILSAEIYDLGTEAAEKSVSVLSRKASLYRSIREDLISPSTRYSDATITRIFMAAVAEYRIGYSSSGAQKHLAIMKKLIFDRGDHWEYMPITAVLVLLWLGTGVDAFRTLHGLDTAISSFTRSLLAFHRHQPDQPEVFLNSQRDLLSTYYQVRQRAFGLSSPLLPFVEAKFHDQATAQYRSHMAILWVLNRILWDLRPDYQQSIAFLSQLCHLIHSSGQANLKALTVLFMITDCVARMGVPPNEQDHNTTDIMRCRGPGDRRIAWWWETVDAVEIMLLLEGETREIVLRILSAELTGNLMIRATITESSLVDVADEIRLRWLSKNCSRSS